MGARKGWYCRIKKLQLWGLNGGGGSKGISHLIMKKGCNKSSMTLLMQMDSSRASKPCVGKGRRDHAWSRNDVTFEYLRLVMNHARESQKWLLFIHRVREMGGSFFKLVIRRDDRSQTNPFSLTLSPCWAGVEVSRALTLKSPLRGMKGQKGMGNKYRVEQKKGS